MGPKLSFVGKESKAHLGLSEENLKLRNAPMLENPTNRTVYNAMAAAHAARGQAMKDAWAWLFRRR